MAYYPKLITPCAHGQFIVSDVFVGVQPARGWPHRHHWTVSRNAVSGADLLRTRTAYVLAICLHGGQHLEVAGVRPEQAMATIGLLGRAPANPMRLPARRARLPLRLRCRQGLLVIMPDRVLLRSRLVFVRQPLWVLPRNVISGVSARLLPGPLMLHDLTLYTINGEAIHLERVSAADTLRAITLLGYAGAPEGACAADRQAQLSQQLAERVGAEEEDEDAEPFDVLTPDRGISPRRKPRAIEALLRRTVAAK